MTRNTVTQKREKGSLYLLVLGIFIFFALLVVLLMIVVVVVFGNKLNETTSMAGAYGVIGQQENLLNERYSRISAEGYLGKGGYFEVLDNNASVVYCSNPAISNTYNADEIGFIQSVDGSIYFTLETIMESGDVQGYIISKYEYVAADSSSTEDNMWLEPVVKNVIILDKEKNVVFASSDEGPYSISDTEFAYLYENNSSDNYLLRYDFKTKEGKNRIVLIHSKYNNQVSSEVTKKIILTALGVFVFVLFTMILFFVLYMSITIKKPLELLKVAMNSITTGKNDTQLDYSGPKEFVEIVDSFNSMSRELHESERKRTEAELEKQKMLADISHDLKTPITVIQGYSKAVADGLVSKDEELKYLETINKKADALSDLINTFYEYSKLEHPEFSLKREYGDICEYFREYLAFKYEELELAGFLLELNIPEQKVMYSFDKMQLKRVFENILNNSIKANKARTTIFAAMLVRNESIIIRLGDDGVGIPRDVRKNVFKPFVVGNESRTSGQGTGLGLSIAELIVKAHGGTIRLMDETESDGKTMFEISL